MRHPLPIGSSLRARRPRIWARLSAALVITTAGASAQDFTFLIGTYEVQFQAMRVAGLKRGCTLVYKAVALDHAYRRGAPVIAVGNIAYWVDDAVQSAILGMKIGIADALSRDLKLEAPHFAYIETAHGTTSQSKYQKGGSDAPGFANFAYQIDERSAPVIADILDGGVVTIGFNRSRGGLDVMVPLDLSVVRRRKTIIFTK